MKTSGWSDSENEKGELEGNSIKEKYLKNSEFTILEIIDEILYMCFEKQKLPFGVLQKQLEVPETSSGWQK